MHKKSDGTDNRSYADKLYLKSFISIISGSSLITLFLIAHGLVSLQQFILLLSYICQLAKKKCFKKEIVRKEMGVISRGWGVGGESTTHAKKGHYFSTAGETV